MKNMHFTTGAGKDKVGQHENWQFVFKSVDNTYKNKKNNNDYFTVLLNINRNE